MAEASRSRRRNAVAFLVIVGLPCAILIVLGVRLVESDRVAEERRLREATRSRLLSYVTTARLGLDSLRTMGAEMLAELREPGAPVDLLERRGDALVEARPELRWYVLFDSRGRVLGPPLHPTREAAEAAAQEPPPLLGDQGGESVEETMLRYLRMLSLREEFRRAVEEYEAGGPPEASAERLRRVMTRTPEPYLRNRAYLELARLLLAEGEAEEAVTVCERYIHAENQDPSLGRHSRRGPVFLLLARAWRRLGKPERALEVLFWLWDDLLRGRAGFTRSSFRMLGDETDAMVGDILSSHGDLSGRWSERRSRFRRRQEAYLRNEDERRAFVEEVLPRLLLEPPPPPKGGFGLFSTVIRDRLHLYLFHPPRPVPDEPETSPGLAVRVDDRYLFHVTVPGLLARAAPEEVAVSVVDHEGRPLGPRPVPPDLRDRMVEAPLHPRVPSLRLRAAERPRGVEGWRSRAYFHFAIIGLAILAALVSAFFLFRSFAKERRLVQLRADFVSHVTHELKTPLTSITMFADTLRLGRIRDPEKQAKYYQIIYAESLRLNRLIENVLDFSRGEAGRKAPVLEPLDAGDVVERVLESMTFLAEANRFALEADLGGDPLPVRGDPDALDRALLNLVSNAMKFSSGERRVRVGAREAGGEVVLEVEDHGLGVPASERERIFEKFYRVAREGAEKVPGTGLGLSLVKQIVEEHGGRVELDSEPGRGSVFRIVLPRDGGEGAEKA